MLDVWTGSKIVTEGEFLELNCVVNYSKPDPQILWFKDGNIVDISNSTKYQNISYPSKKWYTVRVLNTTR